VNFPEQQSEGEVRPMKTAEQARQEMVEQQIARRGVTDPNILRAFREIPRDIFVAEDMRHSAYSDTALPIGEGQTISQPYVVAVMLEAAALQPGDRILEIGAGSGYAAALAARIVDKVYAIERHRILGEAAIGRFMDLGLTNIELRIGDGTLGWPEAAPFDAILVAAGGREVPTALKDQLAEGGRLIMPVGGSDLQILRRIVRENDNEFRSEDLLPVQFVPLIADRG